MMHLAEHHFPRRTAGHPPTLDAPFQRPALTGLERPGVLLLKAIENRLGLKPRFVLQQGLHPIEPIVRMLPFGEVEAGILPFHILMASACTQYDRRRVRGRRLLNTTANDLKLDVWKSLAKCLRLLVVQRHKAAVEADFLDLGQFGK